MRVVYILRNHVFPSRDEAFHWNLGTCIEIWKHVINEHSNRHKEVEAFDGNILHVDFSAFNEVLNY